MIVDTILNAVFALVNNFIEPIPTITIDLDPSVLATFYQYLHLALWVLPCNTIVAIVSIHLSICLFRIVVSVIKTVWQLLPFV